MIKVDLISDTATRPSAAMLAAMAAAPTGDEQLNEDPTVLALLGRSADLLGQEAAVFLPTGTMCNQISLLVHCRPGDEIVAGFNTHIHGSEGAGAAALAGALIYPVPTATGIFTAADVAAAARPLRQRSPRTRVVAIEQTTNRGGGRVWPLEMLQAVSAEARKRGFAVHMDGARLMNAVIASGVPAADYGRLCDSVWLDFTKGLACPVGAVLAGSKDFIAEAWFWKHRLGGAMRQAGVLAAAALHALDNHVERLAEDHVNARLFGSLATMVPGVAIDPPEVETNIVFLDVTGTGLAAIAINEALKRRGVRLNVEGPHRLRAVTHRDVTRAGIEEAGASLAAVVAELAGQPQPLR
ncbi:threonine aldolase family protein [Acuticoccus mangrovi]